LCSNLLHCPYARAFELCTAAAPNSGADSRKGFAAANLTQPVLAAKVLQLGELAFVGGDEGEAEEIA